MPLLITAQDITITTKKSDQLNDFANSIIEVKEFDSDYIAVKLNVAGRTIGSHPELPAMDVVLYDLYLRVKERTENTATSIWYILGKW